MSARRLIVGISGSSGAILGIRLLQALQTRLPEQPDPIETHLIITPSARLTIEQETDWTVERVASLASVSYNPHNMAASIASGSFDALGMIVIPCSIKSLSAIANSYSSDLLTRAADVTLKEGRPLLLVVREAPLHAGHIRLMELAAQSGAVLFPPVPAFYTHPQTVDEMVDNIVGRVLRRMGIENDLYGKWEGLREEGRGRSGTEAMREEEAGSEEIWAVAAMTLSTVGVNGEPHAAPVYFAADEAHRNLYFFSDPESQHSLDLVTNPRAAAAIYPPAAVWQEIRGLQMRGEARPVPRGAEWDQAWARYLVKFPFVGELQEITVRNTLYTFRPDWARWIDNRRGFGHKEEWTPE